MLEIEPGTLIALSPRIVLHSLPERNWYYAFNVENGDHYKLNHTSFWVLDKIGTGIEWSTLRDNFFNAFEVTLEKGEEDLKTLLNDLYSQKIIRGNNHE
jgi:hypothetical protein